MAILSELGLSGCKGDAIVSSLCTGSDASINDYNFSQLLAQSQNCCSLAIPSKLEPSAIILIYTPSTSVSFSRLKPGQTSRIQTSTDLQLLGQVLDWFDRFDQPQIPRAVWLQCQLALAEGFTNVVRHAHAGKPIETPIEIEVMLQSNSVELRIWDYGSGFDLEHRLDSLPEPKNQDYAGGRGLKIIQQTADFVHYGAVDSQRNCLLIVKKY